MKDKSKRRNDFLYAHSKNGRFQPSREYIEKQTVLYFMNGGKVQKFDEGRAKDAININNGLLANLSNDADLLE